MQGETFSEQHFITFFFYFLKVESAVGQQRSAFQFDTITPKKNLTKFTPNNSNTTDYNDAPLSSVMLDSGIEISTADDNITKEITNEELTKSSSSDEIDEALKSSENDSSSDDNGGFVTPEGQEKMNHRVKRATVVGNPMFSSSQESEMAATGESLGIDDLEMDYDQIMNYFDNLKVNKCKD